MSPTPRSRSPRGLPAIALFGLLAILTLTSCSAGGSGASSKLSLGLAGSTADHPARPPVITSTSPTGTYAFVYDNQIWLRKSGQTTPTQLTHLILSTGATIKWGPLVWSPSGGLIAFSLVQNMVPTQTGGTTGALYYVDTATGATYDTPATGSIYGHTYTWYGNNMLVYVNGGGIFMFGPIDGDFRSWTVLSPMSSGDNTTFSGQGLTFGDIAITANDNLFFSAATLQTPGAPGVVGPAAIYETQLFSLSAYQQMQAADRANHTNQLPSWIATNVAAQPGTYIASLGQAYTNAEGSIVIGAWQISSDEHTLLAQRISGVDVKGGTVTSSVCTFRGWGYFASFSRCTNVLASAGKFSLSAYPTAAVSGHGAEIAIATDGLYIANADGSRATHVPSVGWEAPPVWSPDGKTIAVTQLVQQTTNANGVKTYTTNVMAVSAGSSALTLVGGGLNLAWA